MWVVGNPCETQADQTHPPSVGDNNNTVIWGSACRCINMPTRTAARRVRLVSEKGGDSRGPSEQQTALVRCFHYSLSQSQPNLVLILLLSLFFYLWACPDTYFKIRIMKEIFFLLLGLYPTLISAWLRSRQGTLVAPPAHPLFQEESQLSLSNSSCIDLRGRQEVEDQSTCGFLDGDPNSPRTAGPGFNCRFDTLHALWGFCPTTVIAATDCGLAGNCVDSHSCKSGCGITGTPGITTFSWYAMRTFCTS